MNILIVEVNWLGDVLFSTPAIKVLRKQFPDSRISCLIVPRVKEVLENNPYIDELIINDEEGLHKGFFGRLKLVKALKSKNFDLAVFFHRSFSRALIAYLAGIPRRLGYATWKRRFLLTEAIPMPKKDSLHRVDHYLNIVKPLGCAVDDRQYEFFLSQEDERFAEDFWNKEGLKKDDWTVCLNPGGNWGPKRWPKENFASLADRLIREYQAKIIFSGSKDDILLIKEITRMMEQKEFSVSAGYTNLKAAGAIFKKANLTISGDSGPLHIAASVGATVLALFGPTSPAITGPIGSGRIALMHKPLECRVPCYDAACNDNRCMREIKVEDVLAEVKKLEEDAHRNEVYAAEKKLL
ncbi:MAG: lipopolysaccharide heptosyltransferase II [Candidatus Omnitrophota bacterium]